jgi:hypothetical protein
MKTIIGMFAIITIVFLFGCSKDTIAPPVLNSTEMQDITMSSDYNSIQLFTDSLTIQKVDMNKDSLQLIVSYGGGCKSHQFALYGLAGFLKSNPPAAEIYLSHNGNGDSCKELITQEIKFNLEPLLTACKRQFGNGQILLRIHINKNTEPIQPLTSVSF